LKRTESDRLITTVSHWASGRRKGWYETVSGFINSIECADVVNNTQITVKTVMRQIKDKMTEQDNDEFATELFKFMQSVSKKWLDFITFQYRYKFLFHG
jgi:hypothetical protein